MEAEPNIVKISTWIYFEIDLTDSQFVFSSKLIFSTPSYYFQPRYSQCWCISFFCSQEVKELATDCRVPARLPQ